MWNLKPIVLVLAGFMLAACQGRVSEPAMTSVNVAPVASGLARIYFYRDWEPYESLSRPLIYLNDAAADISEPGGISFRDLPPGEYHVSVDSQGIYPHQFKSLDLRAGDVRYVKIESLRNWYRGPFWSRDTFVVDLIPERQAQSEIGEMRYKPGAS
ncbi:MAG TPA: DUF2846 domain-containing protein [Stellaceae bacterium]|nr:DUF2846 domain-containing protein [Stellaceae bacterium]